MQEITVKMEMDTGHRIQNHNSKCKNVHGHRYVIHATVQGEICIDPGASDEGMVIDFGWIKEILMSVHNLCDHTLLLHKHDPILEYLNQRGLETSELITNEKLSGYIVTDKTFGRIFILNFIPTAENLARFCFEFMGKQITVRSRGGLTLTNVKVYETPNCWADYNAKL